MCWWVCTLPLEFIRVILLMPLALCIYILTLTATLQLWGLLWFLIHFHIAVPIGDYTGIFDDMPFLQIFLFLACTNKFSGGLRRFIRFLLTPFWRLRPRSRRPQKPLQASIAIKPIVNPTQNRVRMTGRLSPELQRMLVR